MAIYKLTELYDVSSGLNISADKFGFGQPFLSFKDVFNNHETPATLNELVDVTPAEIDRFSVRYGDVFLTRTSETIDELGMSCICINEITNAVFNGFCKRLRPNTRCIELCLPRYMKYAFRTKRFRQLISSYSNLSTRASLNESIIGKLDIEVPTVEEQKIIIDIIAPVEDLFLKYSNLVRIDTVENCNKDVCDLIDIIAPLERLISSLTKQRTTILKIIDSLNIPKSDSLVEFEIVKTGKRNANHESNEGKYNFYTCGQEVKKCNEYSFDGKYILLSGNANLYSWWYNGKFDLYQRVYALRPKKDFFTTYYSVQLAMQKLRDESSGSVIKYIKLEDIYNIELYSNKYEHILKPLYICIAKIDELLSHTTTILDNQIKLLIK